MLKSVSTSISVLRIETEIGVQRARQSPHCDDRRRHQHRANRNLHHQQHVAHRDPPSHPASADPAFTISYGFVRSTCRTGTAPKSNPLTSANSNATTYTFASGFTGIFMGNCGNGRHPLSQRSTITPPHNPTAPPASEIKTASVNSLPQNPPAARPQREPQCNFSRTIRRPRRKQAAQIRACGQQDQSRQQHQRR